MKYLEVCDYMFVWNWKEGKHILLFVQISSEKNIRGWFFSHSSSIHMSPWHKCWDRDALRYRDTLK